MSGLLSFPVDMSVCSSNVAVISRGIYNSVDRPIGRYTGVNYAPLALKSFCTMVQTAPQKRATACVSGQSASLFHACSPRQKVDVSTNQHHPFVGWSEASPYVHILDMCRSTSNRHSSVSGNHLPYYIIRVCST